MKRQFWQQIFCKKVIKLKIFIRSQNHQIIQARILRQFGRLSAESALHHLSG